MPVLVVPILAEVVVEPVLVGAVIAPATASVLWMMSVLKLWPLPL